jgi:hypothetical protein
MPQSRDTITRSKIAPWAHVVAVNDIDLSAGYFCESLGSRWRGPKRPIGAWCNGMASGSCSASAQTPRRRHDLHSEFIDSKAIILQPPSDKSYGMRELVVATPDGHRIVFGQDINRGGASGT